MDKTAKECIATNDFEVAKEKFDKASIRWKSHWFNACFQIAQKVKEWTTKYLFDPAKLTITKIERLVKKAISKKDGQAYVYIIKMFDNTGRYVFLKAGKAVDVNERMKELSNQTYKRSNTQITSIDILHTWTLPNSHLAEAFEQVIHSYFASLFTHIPNDRYEPVELNETHIAECNRRYELMQAFF